MYTTWIIFVLLVISVLGIGVLHVLHLHSGGWVWWILGTLVAHTSASTQARCRSDLRIGYVKQRLPAQVRMYPITLLFPLYLSAQHYLFSLLPSAFSHLPLSFFLRFPPIVSLCLLDMPGFQSWWVTRELPRCLQVSSSLTERRNGHDATECMKANSKINSMQHACRVVGRNEQE